MKKINVNICVGNCSHLQDSWALINFFRGLPDYTKKKLSLNYNSCNNCGKGPRVMIDKIVIEKANPEKVRRALLQQNISVGSKKRCLSS